MRLKPKGEHLFSILIAEAPPEPAVDPQSLAPFSRWLDQELAQLVARWAHLAAPNASRTTRPPRATQ